MDGAPAEELNGLLLQVAGSHEVWLIMLGSRHYITSPRTYESLFKQNSNIINVESIDHIRRGFDICDGSLLVRSSGDGRIFLITGGDNGRINKYYISSFEVFTDFSFDMEKVLEIPDILIAAINEMHEIK